MTIRRALVYDKRTPKKMLNKTRTKKEKIENTTNKVNEKIKDRV